MSTEFIDEFEHALRLIAADPGLGSPYEENTRRKLLRRFPFQIIYEVESDTLSWLPSHTSDNGPATGVSGDDRRSPSTD